MNAKKIISYSLLGVITALIIAVIIMSFVTKKLSPTISASSNAWAISPTAQITVSKYENEKLSSYKMLTNELESKADVKKDYESVLNAFNGLGNFSIMQELFLGLNNAKQTITYGKTTSITELKKQTDGYVVEFVYSESQVLKNADGTEYKDTNGNTIKFTKLAIFVDDSNSVGSYQIYIKIDKYSSDDISIYYTYTYYSNVKSVYDVAKGFDDEGKLQGSLN